MATDDEREREREREHNHETDEARAERERAEMAARDRAEAERGGTRASPGTEADLRAELDRTRKALAETNRKGEADRRELAEIRREKQRQEESKLTESERVQVRLQQAEEERREADRKMAELERRAAEHERRAVDLTIDREVERAAMSLFEDPTIAPNLVDRNLITHDPETGKVKGVKEALERVLRDHPSLAGSRRGGGSPAAIVPKRPGAGGATAATRGTAANPNGGGDAPRQPNIRELMAVQIGLEPM